MSAILKLAEIWTRYPGGLNLLEAKNAWVVRPRTPPVSILDSFDNDSLDTAMAVIGKAALPAWANQKVSRPVDGTWAAARDHILHARPMGGHVPPLALINGGGAMLFEYRDAPVNDYPYAFWTKGEQLDFYKD